MDYDWFFCLKYKDINLFTFYNKYLRKCFYFTPIIVIISFKLPIYATIIAQHPAHYVGG